MEAASSDALPPELADALGADEGSLAPRTLQPREEMAEKLFSDDPKLQLDAAIAFRRILSGKKPLVYQVLDLEHEVTSRFVQLLEKDDLPLQSEVAQVLANIAACKSTRILRLISAEIAPELVKLLSSNTLDVRDQAAWVLGKIASNSVFHRNILLEEGALTPLLLTLSTDLRLSTLRIFAWALSNLCRKWASPLDWDEISPAIPVLINLVKSSDEKILADSLWTISYLAEQRIQPIIDIGLCPFLAHALQHTSEQILTPALRAVGNIAKGTWSQCQTIFNCGVLPALVPLLSNSNSVKKEACSTISKILGGVPLTKRLQKVIDAGLVPPLIQQHELDDLKTKREACWAITNATLAALLDTVQMRCMVEQGCIRFFCDMLQVMDLKIRLLALDGLTDILKAGEMDGTIKGIVNPYLTYIEQEGGLGTIHAMKYDLHFVTQAKVAFIMGGYISPADGMD